MAYTFIFFFGLTVSYDFDGWFWGLDFFCLWSFGRACGAFGLWLR